LLPGTPVVVAASAIELTPGAAERYRRARSMSSSPEAARLPLDTGPLAAPCSVRLT